jgi:hypothetical protein
MSTTRFNRTLLAASALCVVLLSGCDGRGTPAAVGDPAATPGSASSGSDRDAVQTFSSLETLRAASQLIVVGRAGSSVVTTIGGVPFTVTDVRVQSVLSGSGTRAGSTVRVRQTGEAASAPSEGSKILLSEGTYLLYLTAFHLTASDKTGQFVITGDQGVWLQAPGGGFSRTSTFGGLPAQVAVTTSGRGTVSAR